MRSRGGEFLAGVKAELPILLGVSPFGLIYGVLALSAGLPPWIAFAMSSVVFAGSAQFVAAPLLGAAAPAFVVLLTTFVVNLRHLLYGASVAPFLKHLGPGWKYGLAYLLTDEVYAVAITRYAGDGGARTAPHAHWYYLGAGIAQWSAWQASSAAGIVLGAQIPPGWGLDFTVALTFIALVVPAITDRPSVGAALSAGVVALLAAGLPYKLGLVVAALTGILVGMAIEGEQKLRRREA
ncbi:MAG: AzlC family ABC transporter permease [Candidatus Methylomirabilales bacterium]